jgi:hypothetical protein
LLSVEDCAGRRVGERVSAIINRFVFINKFLSELMNGGSKFHSENCR